MSATWLLYLIGADFYGSPPLQGTSCLPMLFTSFRPCLSSPLSYLSSLNAPITFCCRYAFVNTEVDLSFHVLLVTLSGCYDRHNLKEEGFILPLDFRRCQPNMIQSWFGSPFDDKEAKLTPGYNSKDLLPMAYIFQLSPMSQQFCRHAPQKSILLSKDRGFKHNL